MSDFLAALDRQAAVNASLGFSAAPAGVWSPPPFLASGGESAPYLGGASPGVNRPPPTLYAEVERIIQLPTLSWLSPVEEEEVNRRHVLAHVYEQRGCGCGCTGRLFNVQANAISSYERYGGLLGIIAVGWGKTLICEVCAAIGIRKGFRRVVYMMPAGVAAQLWDSDIPWARNHVPLPVEFFNLHRQSARTRKALVRQEHKNGVFIFPYSLLSAPDAFELLKWISPDLIICDEAHKLGDSSAARTKRWLTYVNERQPEVVALSGGITSKGPKDYAHLSFHALKDNCPLPMSAHLMNDWQAALGSRTDADAVTSSMMTHLLPVLTWAQTYFPHLLDRLVATQEGLRLAYRARLTTAPAVIATGDSEINASLSIEGAWARECPWVKQPEQVPGWDELTRLIDGVEKLGETPNGDMIAHAIHKFKWLEELSVGFYNSLKWPSVEAFARRRNIDETKAAQILQGAQDHHAAQQQYYSKLSKWFGERHRPGLDTPMLVGRDMHAHGMQNVGADLFHTWDNMKRLEFPEMPERDSNAVRICPFMVWACVEWARAHTMNGFGGVIWVKNIEFGRWVFQGLQEGGVSNAVYCPAGDEFNDMLDVRKNPSIKDKTVVASIDAHGTGKNIQYMERSFVTQWPRAAKTAQQLLGRLHRNGQKADEVVYYTALATEFHHQSYAACLVDAIYIQQTTGDRQKIVMADYDPPPKLYPPAFLRERGFENEMISDLAMTNLRGTVLGS